MSWNRKIKSIYSISLITISFIVWSTLSKRLFLTPLDYKLFLIALCIGFFQQYISSTEFKKKIGIISSVALSILSCFIFFKGQSILLNAIFLMFMIPINFFLESSPIEYTKYKEDVKKSIVLLIIIWIISFTIGNDFVNEIYSFHILYIIMIIILMRETRRYVYDVKGKNSKITNITIATVVLSLSLDYSRKVIEELLNLLMKLAEVILVALINIFIKIFGGLITAIINKIREIILRGGSNPEEPIFDEKLTKEIIYREYKSIEIPPVIGFVLKILILLVILYIIYKVISRYSRKPKRLNEFEEQKEKIVRTKKKKHWIRNLTRKMFEGSGNNRDKILDTYKNFEKITEEVDIYKPYMTATQLKNVTKINVDNTDNLEEMTQVYNEAKFSLHEMTQTQLEQVKKGHNNIKKQI